MAAFSDVYLRSLTPRDEQYCVWDGSLATFGLRVSPGGAKTFVLKRKNSYITLGRFPTPLSLSHGRTEAKRLLAEFTLGRLRPQSLSYSEAVRLYLEEKTKARRARTVADYKRLLNRVPLSGPLADSTDAEVTRVLSRVRARGEYNHVLVALRVFFNWCIKRRYITHNPTVALSGHATTPRSRILADDELKKIWNACSEETNNLPKHFRKIVQLLILTGMRRTECASLQISFISDGQVALPSNLTKNRREHIVPVGPLARSLLPATTISQSALLFPSRVAEAKPFNGWSKAKKALDRASGVTDWTLHDLRRTYRSNLGRIGVAPHIAERLVNHVSAQTDMERVYDKWTYWPELKSAGNCPGGLGLASR
jgi:integrase